MSACNRLLFVWSPRRSGPLLLLRRNQPHCVCAATLRIYDYMIALPRHFCRLEDEPSKAPGAPHLNVCVKAHWLFFSSSSSSPLLFPVRLAALNPRVKPSHRGNNMAHGVRFWPERPCCCLRTLISLFFFLFSTQTHRGPEEVIRENNGADAHKWTGAWFWKQVAHFSLSLYLYIYILLLSLRQVALVSLRCRSDRNFTWARVRARACYVCVCMRACVLVLFVRACVRAWGLVSRPLCRRGVG